MRKRLVLVLLLLLAPRLALAAEFDAKGLDALLEAARKELHVPGAAVVVVRDDKVIYLQGFGVREHGKDDTVSPDTVFPIASCSKAFTATLIAQLVAEGKLSWDDKVRDFLDCFRLSDELADRDVTFRDLLSHRTGMPRHDLLWSGLKTSTEELIRRWGRAPSSTSFRSTWEYANVPFTTAGVVAGGFNGGDWASALEKRLFKPLGMDSSSGTWKAGFSRPDHATPHYHALDKTIKPLPWDDIDQCGGSGAVNSTARDMGQWLRFQLAAGKLGDKQIVAESALKETHRPQMLVKPDANFAAGFPEPMTRFVNYGLGWFVHDYRGLNVVTHSGTLSGIRAYCMLVPEKKFGVFAVSNLRPSYYPEVACRTIVDRELNLPAEDWVKFAKERLVVLDEKLAETAKKRADARKKDTKPSLPLKDYAGIYENRAYGRAEVIVEIDLIRVKWGTVEFRLEHYHFDTFNAVVQAPAHWLPSIDRSAWEVQFLMGTNGEILGMNLFGQGFPKMPAKKVP